MAEVPHTEFSSAVLHLRPPRRGDDDLTVAKPFLFGEKSGFLAITAGLRDRDHLFSTPHEGESHNDQSIRTLTGIKYAATLVGALAVVALAPGNGQCARDQRKLRKRWVHLHRQRRLDVPIDEGQALFADGKMSSAAVGRSS
ncbi:hypothetical protein [Mycolicibacterium psychrotolerans]|uniref:hypothetical protein n=1 Tax=Mycolicibacterium psychrotolerans TaxID=216929 RepID=UPI001FE99E6F|nr:hypothetical protein [Mycolicibacterium psychrotolerans]